MTTPPSRTLIRACRLTAVPSRAELERFFFLGDADRKLIAERRGVHNRLGFALQVTTARFVGRFLTDPLDVPDEVLAYLAEQLAIEDVSQVTRYTERRATPFEHQEEIRKAYGLREFAAAPEDPGQLLAEHALALHQALRDVASRLGQDGVGVTGTVRDSLHMIDVAFRRDGGTRPEALGTPHAPSRTREDQGEGMTAATSPAHIEAADGAEHHPPTLARPKTRPDRKTRGSHPPPPRLDRHCSFRDDLRLRYRKGLTWGVTAVRGNDRVSQSMCGEPTLALWTTAPKSVRS
ncbi:DUF4158 domain-containing protein [Nonomuraea sp. NPDC005501]|uniref:DUF4158 domain-containing protein n=1 Tax=Nonomuraea sp. NPDC005501 TaxID=3156884 RepID=UPI0033BEA758